MASFASSDSSTSSSSCWLPCSISSVSGGLTHAYNCPPSCLVEPKASPSDSRWVSFSSSSPLSPPSVTFCLGGKSLLSYIELHNLQTGAVKIQVAMEKGKHNFITVKEEHRLARNRVNEIPIGHIPCRGGLYPPPTHTHEK